MDRGDEATVNPCRCTHDYHEGKCPACRCTEYRPDDHVYPVGGCVTS